MPWLLQTKRHISKIARRGIDLVYPPQCACCHQDLEEAERDLNFCRECREQLVPKSWTPCSRCGGLSDGQTNSLSGCVSCSRTAYHFDSATALGLYHSSLKKIISRMKKRSQEPLALAMGNLLATERRELLERLQTDIVIPIPMHWKQRLRRGMNSPEFIARSISRCFNIPFQRWILVRCKLTLTQSELPPKQRFLNVRGSFRVRLPSKIRGRRILLVDDVLTTGATCSEAAQVLKNAGAASVAVAVVARAQREILM